MHWRWRWQVVASQKSSTRSWLPFTSSGIVASLKAEKTKISWSERKRCYDNILVERLWSTVKYVAEGFSAKPSRGVSA